MNKYEIIGIVGEGAYGVVYKAKHKETGEFGKTALNTQKQHTFSNNLISKIFNVKWKCSCN